MRKIFVFVLFALMLGCWQSKNKSFDDLKAAYQRAHTEKSLDKLMALVLKSNSFDDQRSSFEMSFKEDIQRPIKSIEFSPLRDGDLSYQMNGKTYRPLLVPLGRIQISFEVENDITGSSYLVGSKDGEWFILSAEAQ